MKQHAPHLSLSPRHLQRLRRYARKRCRLLARHGVRTDGLVDHLVCDAVTDVTLELGSERRADDTRHLHFIARDHIRDRTRTMLAHAKKFPTTGEVASIADDTDLVADIVCRDLTRQVVACLGQFVDPDVAQLIAAYASGVTKRADLAAELSLTPADVVAAQKRLARLLGQLPHDLLADIHDLIGNTKENNR